MNERPARNRMMVALLIALTMVIGLATRRAPERWPTLIAEYGGDTLWTVMVFGWLALIAPKQRTLVLALSALAISCGVEVSQLYHTGWVDAVRSTRLGALVFGSGFRWSDLGCYTLGAGIAAVVDNVLSRRGPAIPPLNDP